MDTSQKLLPMLSIGARMPEVREVQTKLAKQGLYTGKIDGWFGPLTRGAVLEAQQLAKVVEDGIIGPETAAVIGFPSWKFEVPKLERTSFKQLVASDTWSLAKQDSTYEKLTCVGYEPQLDRLVAVVELRKPNGYGGTACSGGSREYVRFFVDWNDDGTWADVGWVDFTAHNGPFTQPRRVSVSLTLGAKHPPCSSPSLPKIRAILAWDDLPSGPDFVPHWGNVVDVRIQIAPRPKLQIPAEWQHLADKIQEIEPAPFLPKPMSLVEIGKLYAAKPAAKAMAVSPARYAFKALAKLKKSSTTEIAKLAPQIQEITGVSVLNALAELAKLGDGNTSYEELGCIGYDQTNRTLNGVITVKLPQGYSGDSCSAGSMEYVGFWLWDAGTWVHLGTTSTRVYDIATLPNGGLRYAVSLPVNLAARQRACSEGPVTLRIRAILSWNNDPTSDGPNHTPVWGNREEAVIELAPALTTSGPGVFMSNVGGVPVCSIDAGGFFDEPGTPEYNAPFGGVVSICGYYSDPPTATSAAKPKYRISVRHDSDPVDAWQVLNNTFGVTLDTFSNSGNYQTSMNQVAVDGWYTYQEVVGLAGSVSVQVQSDVLGYWYPAREGRHWVKIESMGADGNPVPSITTHCTDGSTRTIIPVFIDNTGPEVKLEITHAMRGAARIERGTCGKFMPGDVLHGTYKATDTYFGSCGITRRPTTPPTPPAPPAPLPFPWPPVPVLTGVTQFKPLLDPVGTGGGEAGGTWSFDTQGLPACGYSLTLYAWDRARVNSSSTGHYKEDSVGFCLTATGD